MKKKISLDVLENVLTQNEMKKITGGCINCVCDCDGYIFSGGCAGSSVDQCNGYGCGGPGCVNLGCW